MTKNERIGKLFLSISDAFAELAQLMNPVDLGLFVGHPKEPKPRRESKPTPIPVETDGGSDRSHTARKMLVALKQLGRPVTLIQLGFYARVSSQSSSFGKAIAELRRAELIDGPGDKLSLSAAGAAEIGEVAPLPERHELFNLLCQRLEPTAEAMMRALKGEHHGITLERLGEKANRSVTSSSFGKAIAKLRRLGFVEGPGSALMLSQELRLALEPTIGVHDMSSGRSVRVDRRGNAKA